jgi:hypothetical protein
MFIYLFIYLYIYLFIYLFIVYYRYSPFLFNKRVYSAVALSFLILIKEKVKKEHNVLQTFQYVK